MAVLKHIFLLALVLYSCSAAYGSAFAAACPWLNTATASALLHGESRVAVMQVPGSDATAGDVTCTFTREGGGTLSIAVHTLPSLQKYGIYFGACGDDPTRISGVGNEATSCWKHGEGGSDIAQAIGRVRNRAFVILWEQPAAGNGKGTTVSRQAALQGLAEEVAGSMF